MDALSIKNGLEENVFVRAHRDLPEPVITPYYVGTGELRKTVSQPFPTNPSPQLNFPNYGQALEALKTLFGSYYTFGGKRCLNCGKIVGIKA